MLVALQGKLGSRRLDSHAFGSVFFGLQRMQCRHVEVRRLLAALSAALPPSLPASSSTSSSLGERSRKQGQGADGEGFFLATSYAMAFSGLRLMHDDTPEVAELLERIHALMLTCPQDFKTSSLVNILFGMQNMTAKSGSAVRNILSFVSTQFIKNYSSTSSVISPGIVNTASGGGCDLLLYNALTPSRLGRALLGLRCMSSDLAEVRSVVSALAVTLEQQLGEQEESHSEGGQGGDTASLVFSALDLRRVVGGLRGLGDEHEEVRRLLAALTTKLRWQGQLRGHCTIEAEVIGTL